VCFTQELRTPFLGLNNSFKIFFGDENNKSIDKNWEIPRNKKKC
jgi:hypothetical protein